MVVVGHKVVITQGLEELAEASALVGCFRILSLPRSRRSNVGSFVRGFRNLRQFVRFPHVSVTHFTIQSHMVGSWITMPGGGDAANSLSCRPGRHDF